MTDRWQRLENIIDPRDTPTWLHLKDLSHEGRAEKLREIILAMCQGRHSREKAADVDRIAAGHVDYLFAALYEQAYEECEAASKDVVEMYKMAEALQLKTALEVHNALPSDGPARLTTRQKLLEPITERWALTGDEEEADTLCGFLVEAAKNAKRSEHQELISRLIVAREQRCAVERRVRMFVAMSALAMRGGNDVTRSTAHAFVNDLLDQPVPLCAVAALVNIVGFPVQLDRHGRDVEWEAVVEFAEDLMRDYSKPARELEELFKHGFDPWKLSAFNRTEVSIMFTIRWPATNWNSQMLTEDQAADNMIARGVATVAMWRKKNPTSLGIGLKIVRPRGDDQPDETIRYVAA